MKKVLAIIVLFLGLSSVGYSQTLDINMINHRELNKHGIILDVFKDNQLIYNGKVNKSINLDVKHNYKLVLKNQDKVKIIEYVVDINSSPIKDDFIPFNINISDFNNKAIVIMYVNNGYSYRVEE